MFTFRLIFPKDSTIKACLIQFTNTFEVHPLVAELFDIIKACLIQFTNTFEVHPLVAELFDISSIFRKRVSIYVKKINN